METNEISPHDQKIYVMINKVPGAKMQCVEAYPSQWFVRKFKVEDISVLASLDMQ
ncbi:hypothetical protein D3C73_963960 [compost metagenome]